MSDSPSNSGSHDTRLDELIADYMQRMDRGEAVDREKFLAEHPDFADELRVFFETDEQVERLASPALDSRPATLDSSLTDRDAATLLPSSMVSGAPERSDATPLDHAPLTTHHSLGTIRYFGDYELLEEIARGGMGVVYKARQVSLNRIVAVKMILAGQLAGPDDIRRFRTEAEAAAQLQHPNIVAIHEVGEHQGQQYFSMDYIEGTSLAALVRENPLPAKQAAAIVQTVAEAIHYAHTKGILHRDLKPSNVLLSFNGKPKATASPENTPQDTVAFGLPLNEATPKVTDFGLAKKIEGGSELTGTGQILGTPSYMPPEQAGAKRGEIGPASDVYSLGAILYELLTGRPPFRAETPVDTLLLVLEFEPVAPRLLNPKLSRDLETICLKCLSKPPAQRYGTAADLAEDLRRYLAGEPIRARPVTSAERLWRWCRRKPAVAGLAAAVVFALVLALVTAASISGAHSLQDLLFDMVGKNNEAAANRLAGTALLQLQHWSSSVKDVTESYQLRQLLEQNDRDGLQRHFESVGTAYNDPAKALVPGERGPFSSWFVLDEEGILLAVWPQTINEKVVDGKLNGRDYFRGALQRAAESNSTGVHISRVFQAKSDKLHKFAISSAMQVGDKTFVVAATVATDSYLGLVRLEDERQKAVLVAPRDSNPQPAPLVPARALPEEPLTSQTPVRYVVLVHEAQSLGEEPFEFLDSAGRFNLSPSPGPQLRLPLPKREIAPDYDYHDPVADDPRFRKFAGRLIAGFAPIGNTGFWVIVQQPYDEAVEMNKSRTQNVLVWGSVALALGVIIAVATTWFRIRRTSHAVQ